MDLPADEALLDGDVKMAYAHHENWYKAAANTWTAAGKDDQVDA